MNSVEWWVGARGRFDVIRPGRPHFALPFWDKLLCYDPVMSLSIEPQSTPLQIDEDGVVRVGGTRVTMETMVGAFKNGASAEEIVERYDALDLAEVYAVISYYLSHKPDVDAYLGESIRHAAEVRRENEARLSRPGIRERLLKGRRRHSRYRN